LYPVATVGIEDLMAGNWHEGPEMCEWLNSDELETICPGHESMTVCDTESCMYT